MNKRRRVLDWAADGRVAGAQLERELIAIDAAPGIDDWRTSVLRSLLGAGIFAIAVGVVFFIAFNWSAMSRFEKLALTTIALLVATSLHVFSPRDHIVARAALPALGLLIGGLLALVGQTYQTGADPWQLFAIWALLLVPIGIAARELSIWLMAMVVAGLAALLFADVHVRWWHVLEPGVVPAWTFALTFLPFLTASLVRPRWGGQGAAQTLFQFVPVYAIGGALTALTARMIFDPNPGAMLGTFAWLAFMIFVYWRFRLREIRLGVLTGWAVSLGFIVIALVTRGLYLAGVQINEFYFLLGAVLIAGMGAAAGKWLQRLAAERDSG